MTAALKFCSWRPLVKNSLRGFLTLEYGSLRIVDCPVLIGTNGHAWVMLPGKPAIDPDGRQLRDARGKPQFVPVVQWATREAGDRFTKAAITALLERFPFALDDGEGGS